MARAYHNAWCKVMHKSTDPPSPVPIAIKCIWHVLKIWKANLKNINNVEIENDLTVSLRMLLHTRNATMIQSMINQFIKDCLNHTNIQVQIFGTYFRDNYGNKAEE